MKTPEPPTLTLEEIRAFFRAHPTSEIIEFLVGAKLYQGERASLGAPLRANDPHDMRYLRAISVAQQELDARIPHRDPAGTWLKDQKERFMTAPTTNTHRATHDRAPGVLTYGFIGRAGTGLWKPDAGDEVSFSWTRVSIDARRVATFEHWNGTQHKFTLAKKGSKK